MEKLFLKTFAREYMRLDEELTNLALSSKSDHTDMYTVKLLNQKDELDKLIKCFLKEVSKEGLDA